MIDRERLLDSVGGQFAARKHGAGIVDQHIDPRIGVVDCPGEAANLPLRQQIRLKHCRRQSSRYSGDILPCGFSACLVTTYHDDRGALVRQFPGGRQTDAAAGTGNDHDLVFHLLRDLSAGAHDATLAPAGAALLLRAKSSGRTSATRRNGRPSSACSVGSITANSPAARDANPVASDWASGGVRPRSVSAAKNRSPEMKRRVMVRPNARLAISAIAAKSRASGPVSTT